MNRKLFSYRNLGEGIFIEEKSGIFSVRIGAKPENQGIVLHMVLDSNAELLEQPRFLIWDNCKFSQKNKVGNYTEGRIYSYFSILRKHAQKYCGYSVSNSTYEMIMKISMRIFIYYAFLYYGIRVEEYTIKKDIKEMEFIPAFLFDLRDLIYL